MTDITERLKTTLEGGLDSWPTASIEWEYAEAIKALEAQQAEIAELRILIKQYRQAWDSEELEKSLSAERDALAEQVKVLRDALDYIDSENASEEVLRRALQALATGDGKCPQKVYKPLGNILFSL